MIESGYQPEEIAILHSKSYVLDVFDEFKKGGVIIDEVRRETGMEYKVVFLPKLNDFLIKNNIDDKYGVERNQADLYTAMTRAKDLVYLSTEKRLTRELNPMMPFIHEHFHEE